MKRPDLFEEHIQQEENKLAAQAAVLMFVPTLLVLLLVALVCWLAARIYHTGPTG
jgi:flagellar biogenesis protein FliO